MSTDTLPTGIPAETLADLEALAAGGKPDPELARRVRERARQSTETVRHRWGS